MTTVGAAFLILAAVLGCNSGPAIFDVTGTVSFDGKPIEQGEIIFLAADNASTPGSGMIQNGIYHLKIPGGKKKVRVIASRKIPGKGAMGEDFVYQSYIPPRYNEETILDADIGPDSRNPLDFQLESKEK